MKKKIRPNINSLKKLFELLANVENLPYSPE